MLKGFCMSRFVPGIDFSASCSGESLWVVFGADGAVFGRIDSGELRLSEAEVRGAGAGAVSGVFLGCLDGKPCYAAELALSASASSVGVQPFPLREVLSGLDDDERALISSARQLLHWERTHRYCGRCSAPMEQKKDERAKVCSSCGHIAFPRLNPAIIVAVRRGDRLLLGRNCRYRHRRMFSLVAGFVEVGETLEQAVRREVMEEAGVSLRNVRYFGSQAWPFPSTLMLGFRAEYAGGEITLHDGELIEAGWYPAEALPEIPRPGSISRELIDDFIESTAGVRRSSDALSDS